MRAVPSMNAAARYRPSGLYSTLFARSPAWRTWIGNGWFAASRSTASFPGRPGTSAISSIRSAFSSGSSVDVA
jgi:uncharacterized protein CbrC (UPF0167 family)